MLYIGFDGTGYQTGLAKSVDLVNWQRVACVARRDPNSKYTRFNIALSCIVREDGLTSPGGLKKVHGRYLGAWNAYPNAGYEAGAAVIGLAWSDDLLHWELTDPILFPSDGAPWEHGGLYRPNLIEQDGALYLYYNAKTDPLPKSARRRLARAKRRRHFARSEDVDALSRQSHPAQRRSRLLGRALRQQSLRRPPQKSLGNVLLRPRPPRRCPRTARHGPRSLSTSKK